MPTICISYPSQESYECPVCSLCYSIYSLWMRHLSSAHSEAEINTEFKSDSCDQTFHTKQAVSNHHSKSSNVQIAKYIGMKTCKQVGVQKHIFLRDNPDWLKNNSHSESQPEDLQEETATSSSSAVDTSPAPSPSPSHTHQDTHLHQLQLTSPPRSV